MSYARNRDQAISIAAPGHGTQNCALRAAGNGEEQQQQKNSQNEPFMEGERKSKGKKKTTEKHRGKHATLVPLKRADTKRKGSIWVKLSGNLLQLAPAPCLYRPIGQLRKEEGGEES